MRPFQVSVLLFLALLTTASALAAVFVLRRHDLASFLSCSERHRHAAAGGDNRQRLSPSRTGRRQKKHPRAFNPISANI